MKNKIYVGLFFHYRNDAGENSLRQRIYEKALQYYNKELISKEWEGIVFSNVTTMATDDMPYNRAASRNLCAKTALGRVDVMVIIDADTFIRPRSLIEAIKLANSTNDIIMPFKTYRKELQANLINQYLRNSWPKGGYQGMGSCYVVKPTVWDRIGGMDETFTNWGGEDNCFVMKAWAFGVETKWLDEGVAFGVETNDSHGRKKQPTYAQYLKKQQEYEKYWGLRKTENAENARLELKQLVINEGTIRN